MKFEKAYKAIHRCRLLHMLLHIMFSISHLKSSLPSNSSGVWRCDACRSVYFLSENLPRCVGHLRVSCTISLLSLVSIVFEHAALWPRRRKLILSISLPSVGRPDCPLTAMDDRPRAPVEALAPSGIA